MDKTNGKLTVYFEKPFWVGIFERTEDGKLSVAKVTFGVEPKDYEVQEYIQKHYFRLKFSPAVETVVKDLRRNPKRMHREAKKQMLETGIGTKSQQVLKLQQEQNKQKRIHTAHAYIFIISCIRLFSSDSVSIDATSHSLAFQLLHQAYRCSSSF